MHNPVSSIIRKITRDKNEPLNILTFVTHERYEPNLCKTGHNFYAIVTEGTRNWNQKYAPIPKNYTIYKNGLPNFLYNNIDLIISQNPFVHIPLAYRTGLNVPVINVFHTMPPPNWDNININPEAKNMFDWCTEHVYISEFNKLSWGYNKGEVILHGIDADLFNSETTHREKRILTVANDYINRDWCLGFSIWKSIAPNLPMYPIGDTPGLSKPADNLDDMIKIYQESLIFLNTSTASPIPMSLLEAMACGCACVSAATCLIPDIIEDGVDGFLCPTHKPEMFKERCEFLLNNPEVAIRMGEKARGKIKTMFGLDKFTKEWNDLIWSVLCKNR